MMMIPVFLLAHALPPENLPAEPDALGEPPPGALVPSLPREEKKEKFFDVSLYYSDVELGSIDSDVTVSGGGTIGTVEIRDVDRQRIGAQFGFGDGYFRLYSEDFLDTFDLFGLGIGARGTHPISGRPDETQFLFEYEAAVDVSIGDGDVPIVDGSGHVIGSINEDVWYADFEGKLGAGAGFHHVTVTGGLAFSFLFGTYDSDFSEGDFDGTNLGFYVGAGYRPVDLPITARIDGHLGDISGIALTVGFAF